MIRQTNDVSPEPSPLATARRAPQTLARLAKQVEVALAGADLSLSQYRTLVFLSAVDAEMASALASKLDISRPSVTALVDGLEARGLVERTAAKGDRRRVEHRLTPAGEAALAAADRAVGDWLDAIAAHLDPADRAAAFEGLAAWADALDRARHALLAGADG